MNKILVTGFYGVVKSEDITSVFGEDAYRQDFKPLRVSTYTGQWPVLKGAVDPLAISENDLERLHLQFFKSASRFNVYDGFDLCTVDNRFYQLLYYAQQLLTESKVSTVFFDVPPHATLEVMLYELAHILGIKTVVCLQNIFPSSFYIMESIGASDRYIEAPRSYEIPETGYFNISRLYKL